MTGTTKYKSIKIIIQYLLLNFAHVEKCPCQSDDIILATLTVSIASVIVLIFFFGMWLAMLWTILTIEHKWARDKMLGPFRTTYLTVF